MAKTTKVTIERCSFALCSEMFNELDDLCNEFCDSEPPFSWGDNNRSLVTGEAILNHLDNCNIKNESQLDALRKRIVKLPQGNQTYIDLEN